MKCFSGQTRSRIFTGLGIPCSPVTASRVPGCGLETGFWWRHAGSHQTDVDHAAGLGTKLFYGFPRGQDETEDVCVEMLMGMLLGYLLRRCKMKNSGVVHQDIELSEGTVCFCENALDLTGPGNISRDCNSAAVALSDLIDHAISPMRSQKLVAHSRVDLVHGSEVSFLAIPTWVP
jgi:hypothetical protein